MKKCPKCDTPMEFKGHVSLDILDETGLYQCPACKNVELL